MPPVGNRTRLVAIRPQLRGPPALHDQRLEADAFGQGRTKKEVVGKLGDRSRTVEIGPAWWQDVRGDQCGDALALGACGLEGGNAGLGLGAGLVQHRQRGAPVNAATAFDSRYARGASMAQINEFDRQRQEAEAVRSEALAEFKCAEVGRAAWQRMTPVVSGVRIIGKTVMSTRENRPGY